MNLLQENMSIGSMVAKNPEYARVFEELGIDYCCKGNKTLNEVCDEKKINLTEILETLKKIPASHVTVNWDQKTLNEIIEYILETYHAYSRTELSRISQLLKKVNIKHGQRYEYLAELQNIFEKMKQALLVHMDEEEQVIFPLMSSLTINNEPHEEVKKHLALLDKDHLEAGEAFEKISKLTNAYTPPTDACMTHIVVLKSLKRLEENLHQHIHKENQILFPRVLEMLR